MISLAAEGGYQVFTLNGEAWFWLIFSAVTAILALLVGDDRHRDQVVGRDRLRVGQSLEDPAVDTTDEHDHGVVHAARNERRRQAAYPNARAAF